MATLLSRLFFIVLLTSHSYGEDTANDLPECGEISMPLEGVGGAGGHTELCRIGGAPSLGKCIALLERADDSCTALTFKLKGSQGGRCALHDRSQPDFASEEHTHATCECASRARTRRVASAMIPH